MTCLLLSFCMYSSCYLFTLGKMPFSTHSHTLIRIAHVFMAQDALVLGSVLFSVNIPRVSRAGVMVPMLHALNAKTS